jgi:hypothetical protein
MSKRNWTVRASGKSFQMVVLEAAIDHAEALRSARLIWPHAEVS